MLQKRILVVEDEGITALALQESLEELGYAVTGMAATGEEAIRKAETDKPELVLMDIKLQGEMDGIEAAEQIRKRFQLPVIYLTAHSDQETLERAKVTEPFGYALKPFKERELHINIEMALYKHEMDRRLEQSHARLEQSMRGTLKAIGKLVEMKDPSLAGHHQHVALLAGAIAEEMKVPEKQIEGIGLGALVHEVGLLAVPFDITSKRSALTEAERRLYEEHTRIGDELLRDIDFIWPIAEIARHHHERKDGSGYPDGLQGAELSLEVRIVAVAEVVDSMACGGAHSRTGSKPSSLQEALREIEQGRGTLYDEEAVDACLRLFREKGFQLQLDTPAMQLVRTA